MTSRAGEAMAQAQHMARHGIPVRAVLGGLALHVGHHVFLDLLARESAGRGAKEQFVPTRQPPGVVIGLAAHHHAIDMRQLFLDGGIGLKAAVDGNGQVREVGLQACGDVVAQGRNLTVFLR